MLLYGTCTLHESMTILAGRYEDSEVSDCEDDEDAHSGAIPNQSLAEPPDMLHAYHVIALGIL